MRQQHEGEPQAEKDFHGALPKGVKVADGEKMVRMEVDGQRVGSTKGPVRRRGWPDFVQRVVLLPSPRLGFLNGLGGRFRVREVDGWQALAALLPSEHPTTVVVIDPFVVADGPGQELWTLLQRFPWVPVLVALEAAPERADHMRAMVRAGVSEFLNLDREDTVSLAGARIRSAVARPFKRRIESTLSSHVSVEARTIITAAVEVVMRGGGTRELAEIFGVRGRTLTAWSGSHGLPLPRRILAWLRILLAAHLLEDAGRTRASVAMACGYGTDRSLRRVIQRFIGPRSREPLFQSAARALNDELRACREATRSSVAIPGHVANPMQDDEVQSYPAGP